MNPIKQFNKEKGALEIHRAKAEILVITPKGLIVEVDVE